MRHKAWAGIMGEVAEVWRWMRKKNSMGVRQDSGRGHEEKGLSKSASGLISNMQIICKLLLFV